MSRSLLRPARLLATALVLAASAATAAAQVRYPESRVAPVTDTLHGVAVTDPYRWLEDQQAPDTRAWITTQNRFREQLMAAVPGREAIAARVRGFDLEGRPFRELSMPTLGTLSGLGGDFDRDEAFFSFGSFNTPTTVYRYSVARDQRSVFWRQNVRFDGDAYEVRQVWFNSRDGTRVPMFVAHRRDLALDGTNPVYLTGYGGFNSSTTPGFSAQHAV